MEQLLILNDGTRIDGYVILSGPLFFYLDGITMAEAFELLNNPEKTAVITMKSGEERKEYTGYTDLHCITKEENGQITGDLRRVVD